MTETYYCCHVELRRLSEMLASVQGEWERIFKSEVHSVNVVGESAYVIIRTTGSYPCVFNEKIAPWLPARERP
jgi:hypothetical protein